MVRLRLACDKPLGQVAVRLNHLHPDGASTRITYGVLNLSHRNGHEEPEPMPPGVAEEIALTLDHIAYRVPQGHRIAVAVSSAYWPLIWPAPEAAVLEITGGDLHLPVRGTATGDECSFAGPEMAAPWAVEELRAPEHVRKVETDMGSGVVSLIIEDDFGLRRDLDHGLISGSVARERWDIHPDDPASARGRTHWTEEMRRGDIRVRTETHAEMWSDRDEFHLRARLEAYENDRLIFDKEIAERIPRDGL